MSDTNTPSVFTQPRGDDDDVLGHKRTPPEAPGILARDQAPGVVRQNDEDDVEGHRGDRLLPDSAAIHGTDKLHQNDEDDVEGHKKV